MSDKLSLTELQLIIRDSLYTALPGFYWVTAEIADIRENFAGHCYLELIEKHPDDVNLKSKVKAIIWNNRLRFIRHLFEEMTGESLKSGLKVLVQIKIEYHEVYGLSLLINDIDPSFTIGEMAVKRQQILKKLEDEGVITMNRDLVFPMLPKRIAVISSRNAAGLTDFMTHLSDNSFGYRFNTALFEAAMQGPETETGIISALDRISGNIDLFDLVVIVRGGGSQSDLSWFDNYNIAYHITQFPLPIITGIGHEKDLSVTDIVANRSEKTPTAVADLLIETMHGTEEHILDIWAQISSYSLDVLEEEKNRLDICRMKIIPVTGNKLTSEREKLSGRIIRLINTGKDILLREEVTPAKQHARLFSATSTLTASLNSKLKEMESVMMTFTYSFTRQKESDLKSFTNSLNLLNPANVLKRGYTLTSLKGKVLVSAGMIEKGDLIETTFSDGRIISRVTENENKEPSID